MTPDDCCVLNGGEGAWAFAGLAATLAADIGVDVSRTPRRFNYLLTVADADLGRLGATFVPPAAVGLASDKRELAGAFLRHGVPTPETHLLDTPEEADRFRLVRSDREWCVKFPTGCGASGHRLLAADTRLPATWPRPLVVQEFVRLERPEVFRRYGAGGSRFGWVARRYPAGAAGSPWVAHARGARYESAGDAPPEADEVARAALEAAGLADSFGCVDLIRTPAGRWLALEVGTDGVHNHVDRDLGLPEPEAELRRRVAAAFRAKAGLPGEAASETTGSQGRP